MPKERTSDAHWIGRWVGFKSGLDTVAEKKVSVPVEKETPIFLPSSP